MHFPEKNTAFLFEGLGKGRNTKLYNCVASSDFFKMLQYLLHTW